MEKVSKVVTEKIRNRWLDLIALLVLIFTIGFPRVIALDRFVTPDENEWLAMSANFYYALSHGDFISTYQIEHPGVSTMWAGTAGFLIRFPGYRGSGLGQIKLGKLDQYLEETAKISPLDILERSRQIIVVAITAAMILSYLCARRLIGLFPAFLAFLAIGLDPFHIALSRILHLDGLLSSLLLLSLLAYICFLHESRILYLIISAISAGLACLTKNPGFIIVPSIAILAFLDLFFNFRNQKDTTLPKRAWNSAWPFLFWGISSIIVYITFWPSMWVQPADVITNVILKSAEHAEFGHDTAIFFNGDIIKDGNLGSKYFYFYPLTFLWRTTPIILIGLVLAVWGYFSRSRPFNESGTRLVTLGLIVFIIIFTIGMTLGTKKFDRYYLPVYPPLDIIAVLGWTSLGYWLVEPDRSRLLKPISIGIFVIFAGIQAFLALSTYPYYFSYYNPMLGGSRAAQKVMQIGWGEGYDQAGTYLSQKENAEDLKVLSWYTNGTLSYFFPGHIRSLYPQINPDTDAKQFWGSDYAIIYIHNWQRGFPKAVLDILVNRIPEHTISINGIEYIRIYKLK